MANSLNPPDKNIEDGLIESQSTDGVSLSRWFALYGAFFLAMAVPLVLLAAGQNWNWQDWRANPTATLAAMSTAVKLLAFALYLSLACTFVPIPTGWIVASLAMQEVAIGSNIWATTLIVAAVGAAGSTLANLNDYHLFTWVLRSHRIAAVRNTRTYQASAKWFSRAPFFLLVLFNFIPIPVDLIRMLAATYRYPRLPFAAANYIGRFIRYGVIAFVTYWWNLGWVAPAALLALAIVLAVVRVGPKIVRKLHAAITNRRRSRLSDTQRQ